ncbi:MAG TPA: universal stress protein [Cyanothece sp. UBA12306]|nr:universal stress protein [Cyanothece sp. UBA12306]
MTNQVQSPETLKPNESDKQPETLGYKKILVAVDYLAESSKVFQEALYWAKMNQSKLMIFYCIQGRIPGGLDLPIYAGMIGYGGIYSQEMVELEEKLVEESTEELKTWLQKLTNQATEKGLKAAADYTYGEPGRQICSLAQEWGADLIIVGRRGRSGLSELFLGSVSNYVVHHAPCTVLIMQDGDRQVN